MSGTLFSGPRRSSDAIKYGFSAATGDVATAFRNAWRLRWPLLVTHLLVRLIVLAVLAPLASLLLTAMIGFSGQSAFTDQEIASFLLTPAGLVAGLGVACLLIVGAVLDVAIMTGVLRSGSRSIAQVISSGVQPVLVRLPALARFSLRFVILVLVIALPILAAAGLVALVTLRQYDINYYLTYWPPEFLAAGAVIALLLIAGAVVLLRKLSGWALALNLLLYGNEAPNEVFKSSAEKLTGHRKHVLALIVTWAAGRAGLGLAVATLAGLALNLVPLVSGNSLQVAAAATLAILFGITLLNALVVAIANGALSILLNDLYVSLTNDRTPSGKTASQDAGTVLRIPVSALIGAAGLAAAIGLFAGGTLLADVTTKRTVDIIAHRGASAVRPENSLAAIKKAVEDRADWVEIDVQETADGEVIVAHDSDFMKLAGVDTKIWDVTMEDLAEIDIGSSFDPAYADQRTPTLREALEAVKDQSRLLIELKYYGHDVMLEKWVVRVVEETGMAEQIAVMSLKYAAIEKMQALRPNWRYGVLAARAIGNLAALKADFLAVNTGQVSVSLIRNAHAQGKQLYVWTVDDPLTMSRMISMGVDGLITNKPALARQVMDARNELSSGERLALWITDTFRIGNFDLVAEEEDA